GEMPDIDAGRLDVAIDSLHIAPWLRLLQSDVPAVGVMSLHGRFEGTTRMPRLTGDLSLVQAVYDSIPFPELRTNFRYDQRRLELTGDLRRETGGRLAQMSGVLPLDLTLGDSTVKTRLIDGPVVFDFKGDTVPLAPLAQISGGSIAHLDGDAAGTLAVRGTYEKPQLSGDLAVKVRQATITATGVTVRDGYTRVRMAGDSLVVDSLLAHSGGTITGGGKVQLATLSHPVLDLHLESNDARVLSNELGELFADSRLTIRGPIDTMSIGGKINITRGVVWIPDPELQNVISTGDPAIFAVVDTATARELGVDLGSETTKNMTVNVDLSVSRGTWARSREANVEVYGNLGVRLTPPAQELALTGALFTDQGDYTFLGRRFVVTRGSVRFTGEPVLNPVLQVLANYEVRQSGRAPLEIRIVIGGTLDSPKLTLESDAQPTLSQSDLISFLAFGRSSSGLLSFSGSGLSGGGQSGSSLAGNVAALATKQLAAIALDAMVNEVEGELTSVLHADRLNITPADIPAELTLGGLGTLLRGTEIEIGKYLDRKTFLAAELRPTFSASPGFYIEHRLRPSVRLRTSYESRFLPNIPSLSVGLTPKTIQVIGATLTWTLG
ncbi:MAG: translocation/assembly module TamB domain-containing protein, partial [Gemmatimonadaceae bacterium]